MRDLNSAIVAVQSLAAVAVTAAVNGTGVDLQGFDGAEVIIDTGVMGGSATPTMTPQIQESDDNSAFTLVAAADLLGGALPATIGAAEDVTVYKRGYVGSKRYIRFAITAVAGTSPSCPTSAVVLKGAPHLGPGSLL